MPAKGTSKFEVTPEILTKVQSLASQGLTTVQIGHVLGAAESTIYKYKKNNVEFAEAIKEGQAKGVATITNALFKSAKSGQVTSMIFWLKNRAPDEWKDRVPEGSGEAVALPVSVNFTMIDGRKDADQSEPD